MLDVRSERLARRFRLWDTDGNGHVDRSDFEAEGRRIIAAFGEDERSPRGRAVLDAYLTMWDYLAAKAGVPPEGSLNAKQFDRIAQTEIILMGNTGFSTVLRPTISATLDLCDVDGDGQVNPAEFKCWVEAIGVTKPHAEEAFDQIDADHDGQLSIDELAQAVRDYHAGLLDVPLLGR
ncbi:EF-hand domain-containing protein [Catellatospora sp. KI3]|uniref:EF-hand domain-containing protein n=1 Tax=Catellatospora sp. KI3 TaxID=3041620 RepID=UPI0024821F0F|nr:EF-hand domain-containing protein [Catellatospora sp. KI3]MDI1464655.1 EF-hand domain-containing protein [Catellatospora sp. KI3]